MSINKANDFANSINNMKGEPEKVFEELPPLYPTPDRIEDRPLGEEREPDIASLISAPDPEDFEARIERLNLADPVDVKRLEQINNHVLKDKWVLSREEWVHTKDGDTFAVVKYLEYKPKKKKKAPKKDASSSKSEPL